MSSYLVTGGAGFIGSHIVDALLAEGHRVRVLDNFATGKRENIAHVLDWIKLVEGDVRDLEAVRRAVDGAEYVLHQAALPSVPRSIKDPLTTHKVNATGTLNVLIAARDAGVKRVVYASSSSVYGDAPELPKREDMTPRPKSPYAVSKLAGEHYCRAFWEAYGLETVCLRYFNVFGPRQDPNSQYAAVIPRFISALLNGGEICIYGDGRQTRDFTYAGNVVRANLLAAVAPGAAGAVCNVACGRQTSLLELVSLLAELTGKRPEPVFEPARPGDVRDSLADLGNTAIRVGYAVTTSLRQGLKETVEWMGGESLGAAQ
jgi:UDP-glucose 4-epimerase